MLLCVSEVDVKSCDECPISDERDVKKCLDSVKNSESSAHWPAHSSSSFMSISDSGLILEELKGRCWKARD